MRGWRSASSPRCPSPAARTRRRRGMAGAGRAAACPTAARATGIATTARGDWAAPAGRPRTAPRPVSRPARRRVSWSAAERAWRSSIRVASTPTAPIRMAAPRRCATRWPVLARRERDVRPVAAATPSVLRGRAAAPTTAAPREPVARAAALVPRTSPAAPTGIARERAAPATASARTPAWTAPVTIGRESARRRCRERGSLAGVIVARR